MKKIIPFAPVLVVFITPWFHKLAYENAMATKLFVWPCWAHFTVIVLTIIGLAVAVIWRLNMDD